MKRLLLGLVLLAGCHETGPCERVGVIRLSAPKECWACGNKTVFRAIDGKSPEFFTVYRLYGAMGDTVQVRTRHQPSNPDGCPCSHP